MQPDFSGGSSLLGGDFIEGDNDDGIDTAGIVQEQAGDLLNLVDPSFVEKGGKVGGGELYFLTVGWRSPEMWGMLRFGGGRMFQLQKSLRNIVGHGNVNKTFVVLPVESESEVVGTSPVFGDGVAQRKSIKEVISIGEVEVLA